MHCVQTGKLKVWDCRESDAVRDRYPDARRGYSATSVAVATTLDDHDQSDQEEMEEDEGNGIEVTIGSCYPAWAGKVPPRGHPCHAILHQACK